MTSSNSVTSHSSKTCPSMATVLKVATPDLKEQKQNKVKTEESENK